MSARRGGPTRVAKLRFRARMYWQFSLQPRFARMGPLATRLSWSMWCRLCAWDATAVVSELARRAPRPLYFVQIGSNDGTANDPIHETARAHGWAGLLVEPLPHLYQRLIANYRGVAGAEFANVAIAETRGEATLFTVEPEPGDPPWVDQIASLDRSVVLRHDYAIPDLDRRIRGVTVECVTLGDLVALHHVERIDLLHVDAEGFDDTVIGQIDFAATWAPRYIIFEAKHLGPERLTAVDLLLRQAGYRTVAIWPDQLAYRP